ncbi:DNA-binding transcriptional MerR regulator [Conyzicola lurida]|uniref:DNA-binding transcriptional MerR regulator n=1 Tax=Conyzicola lurida TaxID=1172621 RepID=A0A841ADI3_9MICO|nr:DNA-binding transcriptional MerR regulator [Conyzicola lurida]
MTIDPHETIPVLETAPTPEPAPETAPLALGGLSFGEAAAVSGLTPEALRYYENEGLTLNPSETPGRGRRRYFERDMSWIRALMMLRRKGMRLRDVRAFTDLSRDAGTEPERLTILQTRHAKLTDKIADLQAQLVVVENKMDFYRGAGEQ